MCFSIQARALSSSLLGKGGGRFLKKVQAQTREGAGAPPVADREKLVKTADSGSVMLGAGFKLKLVEPAFKFKL